MADPDGREMMISCGAALFNIRLALRSLGWIPQTRVLPAGPTVTDMLANAAFLIGLTLWLADRDERWTYAVPFERAEHGFYRAAQHGLAAELSWPADCGDGSGRFPPPSWCPNCCPRPGGASGRGRGRGGSRPPARRDQGAGGQRADRAAGQPVHAWPV